MNILQNIIKDKWIVIITFESFTFTNGNGPFFLASDLNDWKVEDDMFKIETPPHGGANSLQDFKFELPASTKEFEFKIWNSRIYSKHAHWIEPNTNGPFVEVYNNYNNFTKNHFGTFNVGVTQSPN